ncbi:MAG: hypothetical protein WBD73_08170 [Candidatus Acidiferrales bacterium]
MRFKTGRCRRRMRPAVPVMLPRAGRNALDYQHAELAWSPGRTPHTAQYPGGYFHKTHTVFGSRLEHPIVVRISMDGYASQQIALTEGLSHGIHGTATRKETTG